MSNTLNSNGFDTGSNYRFGDKMLQADFPRSLFDLSHLVSTTIPNAGIVFPISLWRTLPTDEYDISVRSLLRVLPQVVPLYSRQRLYVYAFYSRMGDLWENWNTFARKGMSGNVVKTIPVLCDDNCYIPYNNPVAPNSLGDFLGFPIGTSISTIQSGKFSCLPFMMYTRIYRDYFFNKNFAVGGSPLADIMPWLFPDNDDRFRLNDAGQILSVLDAGRTSRFDLSTSNFGVAFNDSIVNFSMFCHLYPDDYFTSALPFQQRGEAPTLNFDASLSNLSGLLSAGSAVDLFQDVSFGSSPTTQYIPLSKSGLKAHGLMAWVTPSDSTIGRATLNADFNNWFTSRINSSSISSTGSASGNFSITLNSLRELAISQLELERMARTDGSYEEFGKVFFGVSSKNAIDFKPVFIGGTYSSISFTEVLQTSASTDSSALGTYGGHGIAADNSGYLGHVYCDDYGYIMVLACIMPDVYYSQGIDKHWTELNQSELVLPDRTKLGMQPILNQELYLQDYSVVDTDGNSVNENLWAYQDVFDDYRYMSNRIHGQIADSSKRSFYPYTQSRHFDSLPNWSREFATATDVRKDYLAAPGEDAYTCQFSVDVRAVRPLPYKAVPAQIIN